MQTAAEAWEQEMTDSGANEIIAQAPRQQLELWDKLGDVARAVESKARRCRGERKKAEPLGSAVREETPEGALAAARDRSEPVSARSAKGLD